MVKELNIIFWGTSEFAVPALEALVTNGYSISAVITNPDMPVGRKKILTPPPVKILAQKYGIPVLQPTSLTTYHLPPTTYQLFIVAAYGKIIPKEILNIPKYGTLNIHPSLLPRWRGPSPIQYTIMNGDEETGVTLMKIDEQMDHGPVVATSENIKLDKKTTYPELHDRLARIGADLLVDALPKYLSGELKPALQDHSKATYSKIIKKEDGRVDWSKSAEHIERMSRALTPWPGIWTTLDNKRIVIEGATVIPENHPSEQVGLLWQAQKNQILVQTGKGSLKIDRLTLEGKKSVSAADFLHGNKDIMGKILK